MISFIGKSIKTKPTDEQTITSHVSKANDNNISDTRQAPARLLGVLCSDCNRLLA